MRAGVNKELRRQGVREGDVVTIGGVALTWSEDQSEGALYAAWRAQKVASGTAWQGSALAARRLIWRRLILYFHCAKFWVFGQHVRPASARHRLGSDAADWRLSVLVSCTVRCLPTVLIIR